MDELDWIMVVALRNRIATGPGATVGDPYQFSCIRRRKCTQGAAHDTRPMPGAYPSPSSWLTIRRGLALPEKTTQAQVSFEPPPLNGVVLFPQFVHTRISSWRVCRGVVF